MGAGHDQEDRGSRSREKGDEVRRLLAAGDGGETLREWDRQEEREEHLHAGERDAELLEQLAELAIQSSAVVVVRHGALRRWQARLLPLPDPRVAEPRARRGVRRRSGLLAPGLL